MFPSVQDSIRLPSQFNLPLFGSSAPKKTSDSFRISSSSLGFVTLSFRRGLCPGLCSTVEPCQYGQFPVPHLGFIPRPGFPIPPTGFAAAKCRWPSTPSLRDRERGLYKDPCNARGKWNHHGGFPDYEEWRPKAEGGQRKEALRSSSSESDSTKLVVQGTWHSS